MISPTKLRILIGALVISVASNVGICSYLAYSGGLRRILMKFDLAKMPSTRQAFQIKDEERFRLLPDTPAEVVFAGDSLIADGPWGEIYSDIHNRGIGGDRTDNLLGRLDEIVASHPKKVFLLIGSNDISAGVPVVQILRNYRAILAKIQADSPETKVFVSALLPVNLNCSHSPVYSNKEVQAVNEPLRSLVGEFPSVQFLDFREQLTDPNGDLKAEYTTDGYHLNLKAYLALRQKVRSILDQP